MYYLKEAPLKRAFLAQNIWFYLNQKHILEKEPFDDNSLKNYGLKNQEVIEVLKRVFD